MNMCFLAKAYTIHNHSSVKYVRSSLSYLQGNIFTMKAQYSIQQQNPCQLYKLQVKGIVSHFFIILVCKNEQ